MAKDLIINLNEPPFDTEGMIGYICGKTGVGKSYTLLKMLEQIYNNKMQFVFLDPHGEGHVLADKAFDKRGDVIVISERYGIPVSEEAIPIYIDILKSGKSMVIDLVKLFKKEKKKFNEFVEQFLRYFDAEWSDVRTPIVMVMDEAHYFAPQKIRKGDSSAAARVELITDLSTGGRKYGISQIYSSQRPALIDKTPVTQANLRFFGKVTSSQDWNAIKDHVKDVVALKEIKGFTSGTFVVNIGDETRIVKIAKRETKDAGKTPTYKASFSSKSQMSMAEITKKIQESIESARADKELADETASRLKSVERENERLKSDIKDMKFQLDTVAIVEKRLGKASGQVEVKEVVAESVEEAKDSMRKEFDDELKELRNRHQKIVDEKDKELEFLRDHNADLLKDLTVYKELKTALVKMIGRIDSDSSSAPSIIDEDALVKKVLAKMPVGVGQVSAEAPQALASQMEQRQLDKMLTVIEKIATDSREAYDVFSYLVVADKIVTVTAIAKAVFRSGSGGARSKASKALKELEDKELVRVSKGHGYKHNIEGFIKFYLGNIVADIEPFKLHIQHKMAEIG